MVRDGLHAAFGSNPRSESLYRRDSEFRVATDLAASVLTTVAEEAAVLYGVQTAAEVVRATWGRLINDSMIDARERAWAELLFPATRPGPAGPADVRVRWTGPAPFVAPQPWSEGGAVPAHLRADAPQQQCSGCRRWTVATSEFGRRCGMQQPDGSACAGVFG